jgi:hypothetical protein
MEAIDRLAAEAGRSLVVTGGLGPTATGAKVGVRGGKITVTDGPVLETKEVVGGFAIFDLESRDEAIAWAERFMGLHLKYWPGWAGETEIRQVWDREP